VRTRVREFGAAGPVDREDRLATEEPLEVRCAWPSAPARRVAVTMRTPGHDFELATGFLHAEGVLAGPEDLHRVAYCTDATLTAEQEFNVVTVDLTRPPRSMPAERYAGASAASSACGVCGTESIDDVLALLDSRPSRPPGRATGHATGHPPVDPAVVRTLPARLREAQKVFDSTGGLHAAGLMDATGVPLVVREDIGRHNAVDKVVGARLLAGEPTAVPVLAVSGRIGFEIVQKAVAAGVGVLAAVGAPSSLAVDLARRAGLCTIGFVGPERFVTYSAPERLGV
jgi:FdhD protein